MICLLVGGSAAGGRLPRRLPVGLVLGLKIAALGIE